MRRLRVSWDGLGGLPGLSTFYYGVASPNVSDVVALLTAVKVYMPNSLIITVPSSGDELDSATGALTGVWAGTGGGTIVGTGGVTGYAAGTGCIFDWSTGVIHNGRRVKGRTFITPLLVGSYSGSGVIMPATQAALQTAVNTFAASGVAKGIWSKGRGPGDGIYAAIASGNVPNRVTSLRSRRS